MNILVRFDPDEFLFDSILQTESNKVYINVLPSI